MWPTKGQGDGTMSYLSGVFFALTDKGVVRDTNEDSVLTLVNAYGNVLLAVADGMGGHNKGEYASDYTLKKFEEAFQNLEEEFTSDKKVNKWIYKVVKEMNDNLFAKANKEEEYKGMGTTLSLALIIKDRLYLAQIGDSRVYVVSDNKIKQISVDQT